MSSLKEQNGKYYQEAEVVMLATNSKESSAILLGVTKYHSVLTKSVLHDTNDWMVHGKGQHLYFLSDDEIKEDDSYLNTSSNRLIAQATKDDEKYFKNYPHNCKKIIATTDESLRISYKENNHQPLSSNNYTLPRPSDSFIKKYIEEYNAGRQITKVLVEYEDKGKVIWEEYGGMVDSTWIANIILKVNPDNTITITKLKDSYSREEVIELLYDALTSNGPGLWNVGWDSEDANNWIKENL